MNTYRSIETIQAIQYTGEPVAGVTCAGTPAEVQLSGCDASRKHLPHVHTQSIGGMTILKAGDWVFPVAGGPFGTASDGKFRSHWEVSVPTPVALPVAVSVPAPVAVPELVGLQGPTLAGVPTHRSDGSPADPVSPVLAGGPMFSQPATLQVPVVVVPKDVIAEGPTR